jgi:hypothetical protein
MGASDSNFHLPCRPSIIEIDGLQMILKLTMWGDFFFKIFYGKMGSSASSRYGSVKFNQAWRNLFLFTISQIQIITK